MNLRFMLLTALLLTSGLAQAESKPYLSTRVISMELANKLAMTAAQTCRKMGYQVAVSVVDRGGNLLAAVRDPLAGAHTIFVSHKKAQTSATFQTDTITMQRQGEEFAGLRFAKDVLIIGGGMPIQVGGHFYGAVGVSGAPGKKETGDVDHQCAKAGIDEVKEAIEFAE